MLNQQNTIKGASKGDGKGGLVALFVVGFIFTALVAAWTASHNVPMMMSGTVEALRIFGAVAALAGEALLFVCYVLLFFVAGRQRAVTLIVYVTMFLILLFNSVVGYAKIAAEGTIPMVDTVIEFYGAYVAPFPVFCLVFFGVLLIIESSPYFQKIKADHQSSVNQMERSADMRAFADKKADELMAQLPQITDALTAGAVLAAEEQARKVYFDLTGKDLNIEDLRKTMQSLKGSNAPAKPQMAFASEVESVIKGTNGSGSSPKQ